MQEHQSDDFIIPAFPLKLLPQQKIDWTETQTEDFLKGVQGWVEYYREDECVE